MHSRRRPSCRGKLNRIHSRGVPVGLHRPRAAGVARAALEFLDVVDDQVVARRLHGEVAVDDLRLEQPLVDRPRLQLLEHRPGLFVDQPLVLLVAHRPSA